VKGKAIVFVGVLMGVVAGVLVLLLVSRQSSVSAADPTPQPQPVVRAAQNIPKGEEITLAAVQLVQLERGEPVPASAVRDPMKVVGMTAMLDIPQGTILQTEMYLDRQTAADMGQAPASELFQPGRVAVAMPVGDMSTVAGAIREGDRVNILASFEMVDVDQDSQIRKPVDGTGSQTPRLVTQTVLQDVEVLRVGPWPLSTATTQGVAEQGAVTVETPRIVTLLVTPQDAVVLKWLMDLSDEGEAIIAFALRAEGEAESPETEAATLEYLMRRFRVNAPAKLGVTTDQIAVKGSVEPR